MSHQASSGVQCPVQGTARSVPSPISTKDVVSAKMYPNSKDKRLKSRNSLTALGGLREAR